MTGNHTGNRPEPSVVERPSWRHARRVLIARRAEQMLLDQLRRPDDRQQALDLWGQEDTR